MREVRNHLRRGSPTSAGRPADAGAIDFVEIEAAVGDGFAGGGEAEGKVAIAAGVGADAIDGGRQQQAVG